MEFTEGSRVSAKRGLSGSGQRVRRKTHGVVASKRKTVFGNIHYTVAFSPNWSFRKVVTISGLRGRDLRHGWG
jgi:hypothetical protein